MRDALRDVCLQWIVQGHGSNACPLGVCERQPPHVRPASTLACTPQTYQQSHTIDSAASESPHTSKCALHSEFDNSWI